MRFYLFYYALFSERINGLCKQPFCKGLGKDDLFDHFVSVHALYHEELAY